MTLVLDLRKLRLRQWLAALAASSAILGIGRFHVNSIGAAAIQFAFVTIGAIIGAIISDIFGRRVTLLVSSICVIPVIVQDLSSNEVTGYFYLVGEGIVLVVIPLYVSEIGDTDSSGNLMVLSLSIQHFGLVVITTIYAVVSSHNNPTQVDRFAISAIVVAGIIFRITIWWLYPETPHYLNWKKRYQETASSLAFFRENKPLRSIREPVSNNWQGCRERMMAMMEMVELKNRKNLAIILSLVTIKWVNGAVEKYNHLDQVLMVYVPRGEPFALIIFWLLSWIVSVFVMLTVRAFGEKYTLVWVIGVDHGIHVIGLCLIITKYLPGFLMILCVRHVGDLIFIGVTLAYAGEFFTVNVRSIAIVLMIIWDRLMSIIFCSIDWGLQNIEYHGEMVYIYVHPLFIAAALFISMWFIIIFFPRTNTLPCSEIKIENSTDIESVQLEETRAF